MKTPLLIIAAATLFCGFTATPEHERKTRETARDSITLVTQECWTKLKGKAQVEWYRHLRAIDEPGRADAIMMSTMREVERCVGDAVGSQEYDPALWKTVDTFVQQRFGTHRRAG
ncbi:MAG: hypothetical protein ACHQ7H_06340 [Candidatus Rokuibacteriota bacterium]|jgi:hypothetical protein